MEANVTGSQNHSDLSANVKIGLVALVPEWCRLFLTVFMTIIFFTGLPGNIVVLIVQTGIKRKTSTDWFIIFLAICDVMSLVICVPVYVTFTKQWWPVIGSDIGCKFHNFVLHMTFAASTVIIAFIGLDRLCKTKLQNQQIGPKRALKSALTIFGLSSILGIVAAFCQGNNILGQCIYDPSRKILQTILYLIFLILTTVSSFVMFYSYIRIVIILKSRMKIVPVQNVCNTFKSAKGTRENATTSYQLGHYSLAVRTTKLMFLVTAVFIVSAIIPSIAVITLTATNARKTADGRIVMFFLTRMYLINNCTNPYFYIWLNTAFRRRTLSIFKNIYLLC